MMRNTSDKIETLRTATAVSTIKMHAATIVRLKSNELPKKDVLPIARAAAVMAAKKTPELVPYCHPIPLDHVAVNFEIKNDHVIITASVVAVWKTGVEMEALTAASIASLTIYDMLKPIDQGMEITSTRLISKQGGKTDYQQKIPKNFKAAVIVTSDGTYNKTRADRSGKVICEKLKGLGISQIDYVILPDDKELIRSKLLKYAEEHYHLVVTTGGTGLGPRDVTVDATKGVIEREMPGVIGALQSYGQKRTPYAMLSRGIAGVRGKTVIVNLPGSSRGAAEGMNAIFPALLHVYKTMRGEGHGVEVARGA